MIIRKLVVGPLQDNCYIIGDEKTKEALIIDPGDEPDRIIEAVKKEGLNVTSIICTHGHFDHMGAIGDIKRETGARVLVHKEEMELYEAAKDQAALWGYSVDDIPPPGGFINEADEIKVGSLLFKVLYTPGHSPGGICLYGEGVVFTGDTLFHGSVGRTDFYGGNISKLKESFRRLMSLPENTRVYSGHGDETTIGTEKKENAFTEEFMSN